MKIAVFHNLPSGGAKRALYNNVEFLAQEHEVDAYVPSIANEEYLSLNDITGSYYTFPVKNTVTGFVASVLKYFPSKLSIADLEKTQKHMAEMVNQGGYDVVLCEQDQYTMAPFFLKYCTKPTVYYCQQPPRNDAILKRLNKLTDLKINPFKKFIFDFIDKRYFERY